MTPTKGVSIETIEKIAKIHLKTQFTLECGKRLLLFPKKENFLADQQKHKNIRIENSKQYAAKKETLHHYKLKQISWNNVCDKTVKYQPDEMRFA